MTGKYFPVNKSKYKGTKPPEYKSSLEYRFMRYCDQTPSIIEWSYETKSIKYFDKASQKYRRYFIDFSITVKVGQFLTKKIYVEIKPSSETHPPKNKKNLKAMSTWLTNESKWSQAAIWAQSQNAQFKVITEEQLN